MSFACPLPSVCSHSWSDILSSSSSSSCCVGAAAASPASPGPAAAALLPAGEGGRAASCPLTLPAPLPSSVSLSPRRSHRLGQHCPFHSRSWAPAAPHSPVPCASPRGRAGAAWLWGHRGLLERLQVEGADSNPPPPMPLCTLSRALWGGEGAAMGRQQGLVLGSEAPKPPVWGVGTPRWPGDAATGAWPCHTACPQSGDSPAGPPAPCCRAGGGGTPQRVFPKPRSSSGLWHAGGKQINVSLFDAAEIIPGSAERRQRAGSAVLSLSSPGRGGIAGASPRPSRRNGLEPSASVPRCRLLLRHRLEPPAALRLLGVPPSPQRRRVAAVQVNVPASGSGWAKGTPSSAWAVPWLL